jgi:anti-sigma regulatory factor (Ser/Thr protein kinase)
MSAVERSTTLEADPGSVKAARRFVVEALMASGRPGDADIAELLVSELVTNAVLHARSGAELVVRVEDEVLRVEVRDASRRLPTARTHDMESQTGRGLELVELLSDGWGVDLEEGLAAEGGGKSVWFELQLARPDATPAEGLASQPERKAPPGLTASSSRVCLEAVPVALFRASQDHHDGLIREFVLMTMDQADVSGVPVRLVALSEELASRFGGATVSLRAQVDAAEQRGDTTAHLSMELLPEAGEVIGKVVELLEEADRYCAEGALLTLAASNEIRAFRRWCVVEIKAQLKGEAPSRWRAGEIGRRPAG